MSTTKVAHVITRMIPGGASRVVRQILASADGRLLMSVITGPDDLPSDLAATLPGIAVHVLPQLRREIAPLTDTTCLWQLWRLLRRERFDVVHTHTSKAGVLGRIAAQLAGVRGIVHTPHGTIHLPESNIPGIPSTAQARSLLLFLDRLAGRCTDVTVALSETERDHYRALTVSGGTIAVIPNGVDLAVFRPDAGWRQDARMRLRLTENDLLLLAAGRLTREKGFDILVRSFGTLATERPALHLLIAGAGPELAHLQALAAESPGSDRIIFSGHVDQLPAVMAGADIFVLPSIYEGFGLVLLEAMAMALPVVASAVGGVPELVSDGLDGLLFRPGDGDELAAHLRRLVVDGQLRRSLGNAARERAEAFNVARTIDAYRDLYLLDFG